MLPPMIAKLFVTAAICVTACVAPVIAEEFRRLQPIGAISVSGDLIGKNGKAAKDVSGMACMPGDSAEKLCVLVNDENSGAQFVRLAGATLRPGKVNPLIGGKAPADAFGQPPQPSCGKAKKFAEFDGEGVAFGDGYFYVVSSHGCSRNSEGYRLSSFLLARFRAYPDQLPSGAELTYRLSDALAAAKSVGSRFGKALDAGSNGLNIEGIAFVAGKLWFGLRAPVDGSNAYLIGVGAAEMFAPGNALWRGQPEVVALALGERRGIRDLTALPDGRLLVLSGPAQEQKLDYRLHIVDPAKPDTLRTIGIVDAPKKGKAEILTVLRATVESADIAVMFDSIKNGGGQIYRVAIPVR